MLARILLSTLAVALAAGAAVAPARGGTILPYTADAHTLHLYHFDETSGAADPGTPFADATLGTALAFTNTGGPDGRDNSGGGGYGGAAYAGFGSALDALAAGSGTYHGSTSSVGGGVATAAVAQSALQGAGGAFTYEAIVRLTDTTGEQEILSHDGSTSRGFLFRILNGTLAFYSGAAAFSATIPTTGGHAIVANEWFHAAVTYSGEEGATDNLTFYWTRLDSGVHEANAIGTALMAADVANASNPLGAGTTTRNPFRFEVKGMLDEVRISDTARGADDFLFAPEPSTLALVVLGGLAAIRRSRR